MKTARSTSQHDHTDFIQPFLIDHSSIRGRMVRVGKVLDDILGAHNYHPALSLHLAEQIVIACMLSATLTDGGILTVQAKGEGAVKFMVVDVMAGGTVRGYAQADEEALKRIIGRSRAKRQDIQKLLGENSYLAVTLDDSGSKQRYQGIVELKGVSISEAFKGYFLQSQQGEIALNVALRAPEKGNKGWMGGGIIIERMPLAGGKESELGAEEQEEIWQRTQLFTQTLKDEEILDASLTPQQLLYRLFNEDGVWVYKLQPVKAGCRCSRQRIRAVLKTLPKEELLGTLDNGKMSVNCQFCNKTEVFTREDINRLYRKTKKQ